MRHGLISMAAFGLTVAGCSSGGSKSGGWTQVMMAPLSSVGGGAIAVDGTHIIVGSGVVVVSNDDGASWAQSDGGLPASTPVQALVALSDRVLAGLNTGIFTTRDHGSTWTETDNGVPLNVSAYAFYDTGSAVLLGMNAGSGGPGPMGGVFSTSDKGATWQAASGGLPQVAGASSFASLGSKVFSCAGGKVASSTDNGQTWQAQALPSGNALSMVNLNGTLFVTSSANTVFKSSDGTTWTDTGGHGLPNDDPSDFLFTTGGALYATAFASKPYGVYVSRDSGATWATLNDGLNNVGAVPRLLQLAFHNNLLFGVDDVANIWRRSP